MGLLKRMSILCCDAMPNNWFFLLYVSTYVFKKRNKNKAVFQIRGEQRRKCFLCTPLNLRLASSILFWTDIENILKFIYLQFFFPKHGVAAMLNSKLSEITKTIHAYVSEQSR